MQITRRAIILGGVSVAATLAMTGAALAQSDSGIADQLESTEEFGTASDAYIYGYPLVTMEMTRRVVTNVTEQQGSRGPMGTIIKLRQYPDASFRDVTAPNANHHGPLR